MRKIDKFVRITGPKRAQIRIAYRRAYERGASIRDIADRSGKSYGSVHRVLSESGVTLRQRGGSTGQRRDAR